MNVSKAIKLESKLINIIEKESNYGVTYTLLLAHNGNEENENNTWFLDTNASNHMTRKKELSIDLVESVRDNVIFDDNSKISVQDKGNVLIKLKHGNHDFILNVYYVPNLHRNLLSLSQIL